MCDSRWAQYVKAPRSAKFIVFATALAAIAETAIVLLGRWLKVHIPIGVTIGLLMGVVAWCSSYLYKSNL